MKLFHLPFRYQVPIGISLAILGSGVIVALVMIWMARNDMRTEFYQRSHDLGSVMVNSLVPAMKHDDLWGAYQTVQSGPVQSAHHDVIFVLDQDHAVYVSSDPSRYPVTAQLRAFEPELGRLQDVLSRSRQLDPWSYDEESNQAIYAVLPMIDDGVRLGTLVIGVSRSHFLPKLYSIYWQVTLSSLAVLAVLIPLGWLMGNRLAAPLVSLSQGMSQIGQMPAREITPVAMERNDEVGQLALQFNSMLEELVEKERLETQVVASERLAAVGQLAAGVAHEINNPLGGMLNAISTQRRFGNLDPVTGKTLDLLERGLEQIKETVSALLVEARSESHALSAHDVDDVYTLLQPDAQKNRIKLIWHNELLTPVQLPSTPIRQVLINLSLNAVQASQPGGQVSCRVFTSDNTFSIHVSNEGRELTSNEMGRMFEPFHYSHPQGHGLGLWVTYQIVHQLRGEITVESQAGVTEFDVRLPIEAAA